MDKARHWDNDFDLNDTKREREKAGGDEEEGDADGFMWKRRRNVSSEASKPGGGLNHLTEIGRAHV